MSVGKVEKEVHPDEAKDEPLCLHRDHQKEHDAGVWGEEYKGNKENVDRRAGAGKGKRRSRKEEGEVGDNPDEKSSSKVEADKVLFSSCFDNRCSNHIQKVEVK